jgi:drug/metabolite transporter (DMT)-like permease
MTPARNLTHRNRTRLEHGVKTNQQFFTRGWVLVVLASFCCLLWGSSYPAIKNGYAMFDIAAQDVPSKMVFAGYRFVGAGLILLLMFAASGRAVFRVTADGWRQLAILGTTQTAIQYVFFYIGLAYTTGVKSSIMNATVSFFSVLLAHFIYHNDRLTWQRTAGCLIGFAGVMVVNMGRGGLDFEFTLLGEGFVVIAAFILAAASIYGKRVSQKMDSVLMTGWQLFIGGCVLLAAGYAVGGTISGFTFTSTALLIYLALLSSAAFSLWSLLMKYNSVGKVSIFNFLVPIFGALLSAAFLDERILEWKNLLALVLVCAGIWMVTREKAQNA